MRKILDTTCGRAWSRLWGAPGAPELPLPSKPVILQKQTERLSDVRSVLSVLHQTVSRERYLRQTVSGAETDFKRTYSDRGRTCGGVKPSAGICSRILADNACSDIRRLFKSFAAFRISLAAIRICHHPISHSSIL